MSNRHSGNMLNEITREEHDGDNNAKRVNVVAGGVGLATVNINSSATIFAVVNTAAAGQASVRLDGNVTLSDSKGFIGLATVNIGSSNATLFAVVNTSAAGQSSVVIDSGANYIGLVTVANTVPVTFSGNVTLSDPKTFIGLTTTTLGASPAFIGITTIANKDRTITGNMTLSDAKTYIGLVTVGGGTLNTVAAVTDITNPVALKGNLTLSDPKGFIGLTTTVIASAPTIFAVVNTAAAGQSSVVLDASKNFIGLVTVANASIPVTQSGTWDEVGINDSGNSITIDGSVGVLGNVTITDSKGYIGLVTATIGNSPVLGAGVNGIGFATVNQVNQPALVAGAAFIGLATVNIGSSNATLFAVVNTAAAGQSSVVIDAGPNFIGIVTVANKDRNIVGNVTLSDSKTYIGLTTTTIGNNPVLGAGVNSIGFASVTPVAAWPDPKGYIGLVTITGSLAPAAGNITLDGGSLTGIKGNVTITDSKGFIGLVTVGGGILNTITAVTDITNPVAIKGNLTLSDSKTFIGLTTTTLGVSDRFIGLVTAVTQNAGTNKTLIHKNIAFAQASIVTIAVPTNTFKITQLLINSNATTRINIKSGASYLTGNVSLGMNINPGGGWVENGSPDSPVYIGLAAASAIVIEKFDTTATSAQIGGKLIYFEE